MEPREALDKYYMFRYYTHMSPPHSYTFEEVATMLGIHPESLHSYIVSSELPAEPVGNSYRVAEEDIEDFLLARSKGIVLRRERRCAGV